ncbi:MAG TPA: hypothetical protein PLH14_07775 [Sphaerochaeta sp.]|nr:hypothetical protein [Sphaerochaeta sp.]HQB90571.1 hypothetical protein [Sphaerochaeta sp.]
MRVKFIALLTALVVVPAIVFAAPVVVTWEWMLEDPMVTTFRYQLDGEDEANWTVVDSFVTSYTEVGLDGDVPHTLYLQQSYDGINFSGSAISVAEPLLDAEYESFAEEVFDEAPEAVVDEAPEAVVDEAPEAVAEEAPETIPVPVAKPAKVKPESRYYTTITLGGTFDYQLANKMPTYSMYNVKAGVGLNLNNLVTFNKAMGLGVDIDVAYSPYMKSTKGWKTALKDELLHGKLTDFFDSFDHALDASATVMLNMHSSKVAFDLGVGGFFIWGPELVANSAKDTMLFGPLAKASLAYRFNETFSLGVSGKAGLAFSANNYKPIENLPMFVEGNLFVGFSF